MVGASATTPLHIQGLLTYFVLSVPQTDTVHMGGVRCLWMVQWCCSNHQKSRWCLVLHIQYLQTGAFGISRDSLEPTAKSKTKDECSQASGLDDPENHHQLRLNLSKVFMVLNDTIARLSAADAP